jgi:tRNA(Arg) A34 adenosine deaminase TadA
MAENSDRRDFLRGVALGGAGGAATAGLGIAAIDWRAQPPSTAAVFPALDHDRYMRLAIEQARKVPELPFGAVIVNGMTGAVVASGHNRSKESPTFHGEMDAINRCAADHSGIKWAELALYTTAEPCPMCQSAIEWAGIALTVYGTSVARLVELGWQQIDIRAAEVIQRTPFRHTALLGGVLAAECNALFEAVPTGLYREKR